MLLDKSVSDLTNIVSVFLIFAVNIQVMSFDKKDPFMWILFVLALIGAWSIFESIFH